MVDWLPNKIEIEIEILEVCRQSFF